MRTIDTDYLDKDESKDWEVSWKRYCAFPSTGFDARGFDYNIHFQYKLPVPNETTAINITTR